MLRNVVIISLVFLTFTSIQCSKKTKDNDIKTKEKTTTTTRTPTSKEDQDVRNDKDLIGIMRDCNETFRFEMSYLELLNESGSFPDETDRTPKCYIRCVLESSGVASEDGQFDPRKAAVVLAQVRGGFNTEALEEMASNCVERKETCMCERSYQFIKCLMEKEIEKLEKDVK